MKNKFNKIKPLYITILLVVLTTTLALAAESEKWRKDKPCGHQLPGLQSVKMEGCQQAYCSDLPTGARLCACLKSDETGETQISFEPKNLPKKQWTVEVFPPGFGADSFRLDSADLNADGREELLFGVMESMGQGMGVQNWKLWALDGNEVSNEINVADYGVMSFLTCSNDHKGALLLGSRWVSGWEPRRGEGLYIAAQWYELGCGSLSPTSNRPGIYHRYLSSLGEERGQEFGKDRPNPVQWYSKKNAHILVGPYPFE
jgi:hypothetical protein